MTALEKMEAGDDAVQIHSDSGTFNFGTEITVSEVLEIGKGAARTVLMESWPFAEKLIDQRIQVILESIVKKMREKDEALLSRFKDPRFLAVLTTVEKSFAETGDIELGEILSGLLADLASKSIRSRREIVLRQAVECAPRLTTTHLNALSVIFRIERIRYPYVANVAALILALNEDLSPYFDSIPEDTFDYEYMGSTEAGTYLSMTPSRYLDRVFTAHRNALYEPFVVNDFMNELNQGTTIDDIQARLNEVVALLKLVPDDPNQRIKLDWEDGERILSVDSNVVKGLNPGELNLRSFLQDRSITSDGFEAAVREQAPELAQFFDRLQSSRAFNFRLSPVGLMLARHEMESRSPETAAQLDALFED